ncbi:MAG: hypothetical protein OXF98_04145, partial [Rhodospirillaceae bacterium]|nr:hypothetical protein [Rhodospirillaceae bacterium]
MRLVAGDAGTLAALYDRHAGAMYSLAMRIAGEPGDAQAILQGVFAAAWSEAGRQAGGHAPSVHWLLATTRVRAIDHMRAAGAVGESTPAAPRVADDDVPARARPGDVATLHLPDPARDRTTDEHDPDDVPRMRSAFRELPPLERLAIELAYFEGLTISQIATRLEQAPDATNARIRTGLQRLAGSVGAPRMGETRHDMPPTRELAALYALGALNATERAAFDAHLEVDRESVDEVLSLLPVARRLAWTVPPHEPPPGLRERIMETVTGAPPPGAPEREATESAPPPEADAARESRAAESTQPMDDGDGPRIAATAGGSEPEDHAGSFEPPDTHDSPELSEAGGPPEPATTAPDAVPVDDVAGSAPLAGEQATPTVEKATLDMPKPTSGAQQKAGRWALLALVAGSLVVAAGLGLVAARQNRLATALQENLDAANTQARIAELETAAARRIAGELQEAARVLTAGDVQTLELAGQPSAPDARGRLFWSATGGALLAATGLPPLPPGRIYQLWLIPEATPISAAL